MFAAVCVLLAATGHVLMSGRDLPAPVLLPAFAGTFAAAWFLAGRERGPAAVTTTAVAVQGVLHGAFSRVQGPAPGPDADTAPAPAMDHTAVEHMAHLGMSHAPPGGGVPVHDMTDMASSPGMLSAHLLAALLSGLWLAYGERAFFRVVRALPLWRRRSPRPLWRLLSAVVPAPARPPRVRPVRAGDAPAPRRLLLARPIVSRGPPPASAVL
ncbi:hypothetical protein [Streptomyces griseus]|uniref:hypothetical protein n=1 Tax=Streptomyces griseus TaxID=1911 RepID=UPI000B07D4D3|nr:hypothetical protein [Streptomyces griseus]